LLFQTELTDKFYRSTKNTNAILKSVDKCLSVFMPKLLVPGDSVQTKSWAEFDATLMDGLSNYTGSVEMGLIDTFSVGEGDL